MTKVLVLDFDETLASSMYASNEKHADELLETYGQYWHGVKFQLPNDGWYVSFIRSWSKELISYFQMTLGLDNICILSWGTNDYVLRAAHLLDLGISPQNTFTREDIGYTVPRFENKNNVLVDNENYSYHRGGYHNKVNFLYGLEPEKLVQVTNFDVRYFQEGLDITLEELIKKIETAFDYEAEV
jgi:hypothetical protein